MRGLLIRTGILVVLLVAGYGTVAQVNQVARFEKDFKHSEQAYLIVPMKDRGLALVRENDKFRDGQKVYSITLLDTLLHETSRVDAVVSHRMSLIGYEYTGDFLYILLKPGEADVSELSLLEINVTTSELSTFEINHDFNFKLTHFSVVERSAIIGGYVGRELTILLYDIPTDQVKVLPGFISADTELLDLRVNQNQTFNTLVTNRSSRMKKTLHLRTFDRTGLQLIEDEIEVDQDHSILSALTSGLVRDELMIAGTYTNGNAKIASGFFSVVVDPFQDQAIRYYDVPQLNHFLDYMNPKRAEKIKAGARKDREHSKDPEFKASVSNIKLEERQVGFYLLAEAYSATTSNSGPYSYNGANPYYAGYGSGYYNYSPFSSRYYNSPYTYYNQPIRSDYSIFSSSVVSFSPDGKVEWDHSMKLSGDRRAGLEQMTDFWCNKNKIVIVTKAENELWVKARYKNNEVASDTVRILQNTPTEQVKDDTREDGGVRHWYSNKFYVWGYQSIHDSKRIDDRNRDVFYIVKVDAY